MNSIDLANYKIGVIENGVELTLSDVLKGTRSSIDNLREDLGKLQARVALIEKSLRQYNPPWFGDLGER